MKKELSMLKTKVNIVMYLVFAIVLFWFIEKQFLNTSLITGIFFEVTIAILSLANLYLGYIGWKTGVVFYKGRAQVFSSKDLVASIMIFSHLLTGGIGVLFIPLLLFG